MSVKDPSEPRPQPKNSDLAHERRKARLAEQLRINLQRRKAQARSRRAGEADQRPDGLVAATHKGNATKDDTTNDATK